MFTKYNEYELLELFQSEPVSISGNTDDGELIYTYKDDKGFKVILTLDTYQQLLTLSITYNDLVVFTGELTSVTSIRKSEEAMLIEVDHQDKLRVKFSNQVGVELL
nr:hypothetical protein [Terribacillus saccharophilus]